MFELMGKFLALVEEGDVEKIAATLPTIQADLELLGEHVQQGGFLLKRIAVACTPIIEAAKKMK